MDMRSRWFAEGAPRLCRFCAGTIGRGSGPSVTIGGRALVDLRRWRRVVLVGVRWCFGGRRIARQTPCVSITIRRTALAKRRLGRRELRPFSDWNDGRPETELNFKLYRQATNKIVGISDEAAAFLRGFF
jgi:hypothetical protein